MEFVKETAVVVAIALVIHYPLNYLLNQRLGVKEKIHSKFYEGKSKVGNGLGFFVVIMLVYVMISISIRTVGLMANYRLLGEGIQIGLLVLMLNTFLPLNLMSS